MWQRSAASDSNFRCRKGKWFRLRKPGLHRFLISGPNLGIDARISRFKPSFVHRFLISWGKLGNRCKECSETTPLLQRFRISGGKLGNRCKGCRRHRRMARLQHNRYGGREWPACYGLSGDDLPRPILFFAAAKENGPPATVVAVTAICRLRFYLRLTPRNS